MLFELGYGSIAFFLCKKFLLTQNYQSLTQLTHLGDLSGDY